MNFVSIQIKNFSTILNKLKIITILIRVIKSIIIILLSF